jgi:hypothetical protein
MTLAGQPADAFVQKNLGNQCNQIVTLRWVTPNSSQTLCQVWTPRPLPGAAPREGSCSGPAEPDPRKRLGWAVPGFGASLAELGAWR